MIDIKNSRSMRDDMHSLSASEKQLAPLPELIKRGTVPAARGVGSYTEAPSSGGGEGGIASPLTELSFIQRVYFDNGVRSSDGLFFIPAVQQMTMIDANDDEVVFNFAKQGDIEGPEP